MTITKREIEKLQGIGYGAVIEPSNKMAVLPWSAVTPNRAIARRKTEAEAWTACKTHAQSPDGLVASMAAKVRWLCQAWPEDGLVTKNLEPWHIALVQEEGTDMALTRFDGSGPSPEAAVDALFWGVQ